MPRFGGRFQLGRAQTITVGASNSYRLRTADFQCDNTNDQTELNNAILALPSAGGMIQLSEGLFTIAAPVSLLSNVTFAGRGAGITTLRIVNSAGAAFQSSGVLVATERNHVSVRDLTLDGNRANNANGRTEGFRWEGVQYSWIDNCEILSIPDDSGAETSGGDGINLTSSVNRSFDIWVRNCLVRDCARSGFLVAAASRVHIVGCKVDATVGAIVGAGYYVGDGVLSDIFLTDCQATACQRDGFTLTTGGGGTHDGIYLSNCSGRSNLRYGFNTNTSRRVEFSNCSAIENSSYGWNISGLDDSSLVNCHAYNNNEQGMVFQDVVNTDFVNFKARYNGNDGIVCSQDIGARDTRNVRFIGGSAIENDVNNNAFSDGMRLRSSATRRTHRIWVIGFEASNVARTTGAITCSVNATNGTFTRTAGSFLTDGFVVGQGIVTSGFTNAGNNTNKRISAVTATVITVTSNSGLVTETPGTGDEVIQANRQRDGFDLTAMTAADQAEVFLQAVAAEGNIDNNYNIGDVQRVMFDTGGNFRGFPFRHQTLAANTNLTLTRGNVIVDVTTGAGSDNTITLPDASVVLGEEIVVHMITDGGMNAVLNRAGADVFREGATTGTVITLDTAAEYVRLQAVSGNLWTVVQNYGGVFA